MWRESFLNPRSSSGNPEPAGDRVIIGNCPFSTEGLGITPGNQFGLIQSSESAEECTMLGSWFTGLWNSLPASPEAKTLARRSAEELIEHKAPSLVYFLILFHLFKDLGEELDEERIVKSATGIRNTNVWKKLFKFQRDGVVGAIDKLERLGGCIIADSVGLGKTFEALADHQVLRAAQRPRARARARSACATTGRSTRPTTAATSWRPTASTTMS